MLDHVQVKKGPEGPEQNQNDHPPPATAKRDGR